VADDAGVRIRLLGGFEVTVAGRPVATDAWRLRKAKTLVKLLALARGHRLHREALMAVLWPDRDGASATNNLHQALYIARRALAGTSGALCLRDDVVLLSEGAMPWLDTDAFEAACRRAHQTRDPQDFRAAAELYRGDLLPEDRFEEWTEGPREALHERRLGLLVEYAKVLSDLGEHTQVRTLAEPLADLMGPMPYTAMQSLLDPLWPAGAQNYFTGVMLDQLADETIDTLLARHAAGRAPVHELHLHHGGGAMSKAPAGGTAFAHRNAAQVLNIIARSPDREGFQEHVDWARETHNAMDPWSTGGGYVNFTSEPGQDKVQASYPPDTYARLVAVKDRYDPTNLFQLNQNIRPSGGH
jgi:FAD/FMN-containing dehydrogenase